MADAVSNLCGTQKAEPGVLYVVSTPLGNLGDLTLRSIRILETCDCIACETPNITKKLLSALHIEGKPLFTYRDAGEEKSAQHICEKLKAGLSVALVSDAGTPTISDPGYRLIKLCRESNIPVSPIPGACASTAALSVSGFPSNQFLFLGFLPIKRGSQQKLLAAYRDFRGTLIIYESPYRIQKLLQFFKEILEPQRLIFVAREITKLNETFYRGTIEGLDPTIYPNKGEYVVLIAPLE